MSLDFYIIQDLLYTLLTKNAAHTLNPMFMVESLDKFGYCVKTDTNKCRIIIGNEFDIPLESDIRKDVNDMCNLSQGIKEQAYVEGTENGIAIGKQEGITIGKREGIAETIIKMYRKGYEAEQIGDILDMEVEEVQEIIENE